MKSIQEKTYLIIEEAYKEYYPTIFQYITCRLKYKHEAEDLVQDVFVRLLDYNNMLQKTTIQSFVFTIARNIVTDYLRRYYNRPQIDNYLYETASVTNDDAEKNIILKDLLVHEKQKLSSFPRQRRIIYALSRYKEKTVPEISSQLNLSRRTVENHLLIGRKVMREFLKASI